MNDPVEIVIKKDGNPNHSTEVSLGERDTATITVNGKIIAWIWGDGEYTTVGGGHAT